MRYHFLLICLLGLSGCFTTSLNAPANTRVRILPEQEKAAYHEEYKDWYILAGLIPIYRHNISELIKEEKLIEVRVRTEDRISDGIITFVTDFIFPLFPQTIVVEGNTAEQLKQATVPGTGSSAK